MSDHNFFDLDYDADDRLFDDGNTGYGRRANDADDSIPKSAVQKIVKDRVDRLNRRVQARDQEFARIFNMTPEEAMQAAARQQQPQQQQQQAYQQPQMNQMPEPVVQLQQDVDAIKKEREMDREALEFTRRFPGVLSKDIPPEVFARRDQGGVTLSEAYALYRGLNIDKVRQDAAAEGSQAALRNVRRNNVPSEGATFGNRGPGGPADDMVTPEMRQLITGTLGMTVEQWINSKKKLEDARRTF